MWDYLVQQMQRHDSLLVKYVRRSTITEDWLLIKFNLIKPQVRYVTILMKIFWVKSPCRLVDWNQLSPILAQKTETARFSETLASTKKSTWQCNPKERPSAQIRKSLPHSYLNFELLVFTLHFCQNTKISNGCGLILWLLTTIDNYDVQDCLRSCDIIRASKVYNKIWSVVGFPSH
jgi:hypothetical protein